MKIQLSSTFFCIGICILLSSAVLVLAGHLGFALKVISIDFWVLIAGASLYIWEERKALEKKK